MIIISINARKFHQNGRLHQCGQFHPCNMVDLIHMIMFSFMSLIFVALTISPILSSFKNYFRPYYQFHPCGPLPLVNSQTTYIHKRFTTPLIRQSSLWNLEPKKSCYEMENFQSHTENNSQINREFSWHIGC